MIKYNLNNIRFINENEMIFLNDDESFANEIVVDFCDDLSFISENDEDDEDDEVDQNNEENENNDREDIASQDHNVEKIDEHQRESFLNHAFVDSNSSLNAFVRRFKRSCRRDVSKKNIDVEKQTFSMLFLLFFHRFFSQN
jgi:ABC-type Zn2+ transport system substrate-binding protein/surface adhesin